MSVNLENLSVVDFAQQVRKRYAMYFGADVRLSYLENLLRGYQENASAESIVPYQYFNYWVKWKLNRFGADSNWAVAILEHCKHEEVEAFWKFYELLDEFQMLRPVRLFVADLNAGNFAYYYALENKQKNHRIAGVDNKWILEPAPYHIKLFEFDYCVHAYHFDFYWSVSDHHESWYYKHFMTLEECKVFYKDMFNVSEWTSVSGDDIGAHFKATIHHCRNRAKNII